MILCSKVRIIQMMVNADPVMCHIQHLPVLAQPVGISQIQSYEDIIDLI